jgi:hypothetical protein
VFVHDGAKDVAVAAVGKNAGKKNSPTFLTGLGRKK